MPSHGIATLVVLDPPDSLEVSGMPVVVVLSPLSLEVPSVVVLLLDVDAAVVGDVIALVIVVPVLPSVSPPPPESSEGHAVSRRTTTSPRIVDESTTRVYQRPTARS